MDSVLAGLSGARAAVGAQEVATDSVISAATRRPSAAFFEAMFEYFDACGMLTQLPSHNAFNLDAALTHRTEGSEAVTASAGSKPTDTALASADTRSAGSVPLQTFAAASRGMDGRPRQLSPIDMLLVVLVVLRTDARYDFDLSSRDVLLDTKRSTACSKPMAASLAATAAAGNRYSCQPRASQCRRRSQALAAWLSGLSGASREYFRG